MDLDDVERVGTQILTKGKKTIGGAAYTAVTKGVTQPALKEVEKMGQSGIRSGFNWLRETLGLPTNPESGALGRAGAAGGLYTPDQINKMTARGKTAEEPVPGQPQLPVSKEAEAALKLFGRKTPTAEALGAMVAKGKISDHVAEELINANRVKLPDPKTIGRQDPSKVPVEDRSTYSPDAEKEIRSKKYIEILNDIDALKKGMTPAQAALLDASLDKDNPDKTRKTPAQIAADRKALEDSLTSPEQRKALEEFNKKHPELSSGQISISKPDSPKAASVAPTPSEKPAAADVPAATSKAVAAPAAAASNAPKAAAVDAPAAAPAAPPEKADAKSDIERKAINVDFSLSDRFKAAADYLKDPSRMEKGLGKAYYENALDTMTKMAGVKDREELKTLLEIQEKQKAAPTTPAAAPGAAP